mmetsp:Transcript_32654/g.106157  ORF Transcript_32654/g.106157 Transcript_32654/m.106157 type:complete len:619 (+) Transcript_32654:206-2062(+)
MSSRGSFFRVCACLLLLFGGSRSEETKQGSELVSGCFDLVERTQGGATAKVNLCGAASIAGETTCGNGRRGTFTLEHSKLGTVAHLRGRPACYPLGPGAFRAAVRRNDQETKVFGPLKLFAKRLAACDARTGPLVVVVIGGSVTEGAKCADPTGATMGACAFPTRLVEGFRAARPSCEVRLRNLGRGGDTTMYALARFDPAETADADLLILDETVNDIFTNKEESRNYHPYARIRGAVELLVRRIFQTAAKAPPALLLLSTIVAAPPTDYRYQDDALEPVARRYGLPLVSYRDAADAAAALAFHGASTGGNNRSTFLMTYAWHPGGGPPHPGMSDLNHPDWFAHLLMADLVAYVVAAARSDPRVDAVPLAAATRDALAAAPAFGAKGLVDACNGDYLTRLPTADRPDFSRAPLGTPGPGWTFVANGSKSGWEYDASDDVRRGLAEMPRIRFPVAFGTRPGLVLSVMSSYANFGPGCFWLERSGAASLDVATAAVHAGRALRDHCWTVKTKPGSYEKNGVHEFLCHKVLAHSITLPFIVDGHWGDRSSQPRPQSYAAVGAVPTPTRYVQGAPSFNPPNADQPLSPPNTTDVLVFVAYPPSDAKDLRLGAKVRLMAIETC